MTREQRLFAAARQHFEMFEPFTAKPVGAPGSAARLEQEVQISAHEDLREALDAYEGKPA
jgi:hypothetical protein